MAEPPLGGPQRGAVAEVLLGGRVTSLHKCWLTRIFIVEPLHFFLRTSLIEVKETLVTQWLFLLLLFVFWKKWWLIWHKHWDCVQIAATFGTLLIRCTEGVFLFVWFLDGYNIIWKEFKGPARWFSDSEYLLLLQRTRVLFPAPLWQLRTNYTSSSRDPIPFPDLCTHCAHM